MFDTTLSCVNAALFCVANSIMWVQSRFVKISPNSPPLWIVLMSPDTTYPVVILTMLAMPGIELMNGAEFNVFMLSIFVIIGLFHLLARQGKSKGARLDLVGLDPMLSWWLDRQGNVYPHLMSGKEGVPALCCSKDSAELLLSQFLAFGSQFDNPINVRTPFKLLRLINKLTSKGWLVDTLPSTRTPFLIRAILVLRRRTADCSCKDKSRKCLKKTPFPWRAQWKQCAMLHAAVLYPPAISRN
ncbi:MULTISPECIES: hypothetical protein [Gammaproteobacteria]|uniref:hypothetical protein n=1 Tax=Gammaproteobacteria TaxID=1236 RepID=UPI000F8EF7BA|nr:MULTISPECIES: hypothetical protein [Gammaproteobacteria]MCB3578730.1 hypothetical protein [Klebsiella pneumoniae]EIY9566556.1 hypothetical protein [Escherichia coli]RUR52622.1 hypothetical protein ELS78_20190 [Aeromonas veronii]HAX4335161.1 hypothetical protein [Escherichia coli]HBT1557041.1 hypothetical protein [Klebsiella pneumoniae]